jgi:hypothetical protein
LDIANLEWYTPVLHGPGRSYELALGRCHSSTRVGNSVIFFGGGPPGATTRSFTAATFHRDPTTGRYAISWPAEDTTQVVENYADDDSAPHADASSSTGATGSSTSASGASSGAAAARSGGSGRKLCPRQNHIACLLDGRIFLIGGCTAQQYGQEELGDLFEVVLDPHLCHARGQQGNMITITDMNDDRSVDSDDEDDDDGGSGGGSGGGAGGSFASLLSGPRSLMMLLAMIRGQVGGGGGGGGGGAGGGDGDDDGDDDDDDGHDGDGSGEDVQ